MAIASDAGDISMIINPLINWFQVNVFHQAMALAEEAAQSVDRVLPTPEPVCQLIELGDSTVDLELRVWIDDPENGVANFKSSVLLAVWDIFHANNIEFAFPQRDLHIKSAVPLEISGS